MSKIKPLGDKVLIKPLSKEERSKGGIILPDTAEEKPEEGKVIAIGEGKIIGGKLTPLSVKPGDRVIFKKYSPDEIKIEGEELLIVKEEDILGVIE